ncbi:hypothetical protein [Chamaesiphon sp. OTE_8_metabat_110]|uniref:hypothetical protein n=1 Tax=Chamaesiphon sp. OTE_8_metabat_110 TaxID=2964696 RepID=UPI00286C8A90|nr:hypothetical protein [Chamaesiphon sp. OTE_8_metabat_110]
MKTATQLGIGKDRNQMNLPLFIGLGVLAWLIGVFFIRFAGTMFFVEGSLWLVGLYLLTIPVVGLTIESVARIGKLSRLKTLMAIVIFNFTATLLDAVAIAWLPSIYGLPAPANLLAAAWLLWFVGISLYLSFMMARSEIFASD